LATLGGNQVHICVAIILPGKSNPFAIWGKMREAFLAFVARKPFGITTIFANNPQIVSIDKRYLRIADGRLAKEHRTLRKSEAGKQDKHKKRKGLFHKG
jgi:hypothetical protein